MNIVRSPNPPKGAQNRKTAVFRVKSHFAWRKSATKFLCVKIVSERVVRYSFSYLFAYKWLVGDVPFCVNIWQIPTPLQTADLKSTFAHWASAIAPSKRSSVNTNRKSTTRFSGSLWWTSYVAPKFLRLWFSSSTCCFFYFVYLVYEFCNRYKYVSQMCLSAKFVFYSVVCVNDSSGHRRLLCAE